MCVEYKALPREFEKDGWNYRLGDSYGTLKLYMRDKGKVNEYYITRISIDLGDTNNQPDRCWEVFAGEPKIYAINESKECVAEWKRLTEAMDGII